MKPEDRFPAAQPAVRAPAEAPACRRTVGSSRLTGGIPAPRLPAVLFAILLAWGVLSLWIQPRWASASFELPVFAMAAWRLFQARPLAFPDAGFPLALAAFWPILQLLLGTTMYRAATAGAALDWGVYLLVFLLARELFAEASHQLWFLQAASLFGLSVAVVAAAGEYACPGKVFCLVETSYPGGVMGPFLNRNLYCAWVELLLPASLYLAAVKPRLRALFGAAAAVMAGSVVASASRAGTALVAVELAAVIPALAVRYGASRRKLLVGAAQFLVLAGIAISVVGWQEVFGRWRNAGPEDLRQDALRASLRMVQDRPWAGSGLGTWTRVYPRYATIDRGVFMNQAHDDWAQWAAEGGLPFLLLFFFFVALSWKPAVQSIYGAGMVVFLLHALVDYPMQQRPALAACFFCMAGVAAARRGGGRAES